MKQDFPLIKDSNGNISEWKTIVDHPHITTLSGAVDRYLTEVKTLSGSSTSVGDMLVLNDNDTVSIIEVPPNDTNITNSQSTLETDSSKIVNIGGDKFINAYTDRYLGGHGFARVGTLVGDDIVWGVEAEWRDGGVEGSISYGIDVLYDDITEQVICAAMCYSGTPGEGELHAYVGTITTTGAPSADTLSFGSAIAIPTVSTITNWLNGPVNMVYHPIENRVVFAYGYGSGSIVYNIYTVSAEITGSTLDFGSVSQLNASADVEEVMVAYHSGENKLVYLFPNTSNVHLVRTATLSGNVFTFNSPTTLSMDDNSEFLERSTIVYDSNSDLMIATAMQNSTGVLRAQTVDVSTEPATYGALVTIQTPGYAHTHKVLTDTISNQLLIWYKYGTSTGSGSWKELTISGTTITVSPSFIYIDSGTFDFENLAGMAFNETGTHAVWVGCEDGGPAGAIVYIKGLTENSNLTDNNFYGITKEAKSNGQDVLIGRFCYMDTNQSGLTINTNYYIDSDGTLTSSSLGGTRPLLGKAVSDTEIIIKG